MIQTRISFVATAAVFFCLLGTGLLLGREVNNLDTGWRFAFGHASDRARDWGFGGDMSFAKVTGWNGPADPGFNDATWRELDLPHDWVPELPFINEPGSEELEYHGYKPVGQAFPATSVGWYRKRFTVPPTDEGQRLRLDFDGVFRDCLVWLNGCLLGRHEGGYTPFGFDVTDFIQYGQENILVVRIDATVAEGWFYEGAGIYRHVRLTKTAPVHVSPWGTFVASRVEGNSTRITVNTRIANDSGISYYKIVLESVILDPAGKEVGRLWSPFQIEAWAALDITQSAPIPSPQLWSLEKPRLYRVVTTIRRHSLPLDEVTARFGIRTIRFDADQGFFLNGRRVQINGVCCHQDHAGVGAAVPDGLQRWRMERLKEMGVNAYRSSHNPPAPEILDACDELGILVMDETRLFSSNELALEHLQTMVRRDRNHPCVILWSIGNEEPEQTTPRGRRIAQTMVRAVKSLDQTRPVTYASNSGAYEGANETVDVRGFNYYLGDIDRYHREHPTQPLFGSEIASTLTTRGEYARDDERTYLPAYDQNKPSWGELAEEWLQFYQARPWLAGAFIWTGFDYRGEPTPFHWPCISSHFGILDTCGFPKDLYWYYQSWWTQQPVLHLLPHWNWPGREGQAVDVWVFTNTEEVRLILNGRDLGTKKVEKYSHAQWQVPYEAGKLEAIGYRAGKELLRTAVETTGTPARLVATPDRPQITTGSGAVVAVAVVDAQGRPVPTADNEITFSIDGPGRILGVGNGNPSSHEADVFPAQPQLMDIGNWQAVPLESEPGSAPSLAELARRGSQPAKVDGAGAGMPENAVWAYWTVFEVPADQLSAGMTALTVGQMDDAGSVYLNDCLLGKTSEWNRSFTFDAKSALHPGKNELVIVVRNNRGRGGLGRGVTLSGGRIQPQVHRRLFNGLAQVIIQSTGQPGEIILSAAGQGLTAARLGIHAAGK